MTNFGLEALPGKALSADLILSMKPVKIFFVDKCKLSLALLYLAGMVHKQA